MQELGLMLSNEYSPQVQKIMKRMGYEDRQGLGRLGQERIMPIFSIPHKEKQGLGFS